MSVSTVPSDGSASHPGYVPVFFLVSGIGFRSHCDPVQVTVDTKDK